jgi:hypothetical protein
MSGLNIKIFNPEIENFGLSNFDLNSAKALNIILTNLGKIAKQYREDEKKINFNLNDCCIEVSCLTDAPSTMSEKIYNDYEEVNGSGSSNEELVSAYREIQKLLKEDSLNFEFNINRNDVADKIKSANYYRVATDKFEFKRVVFRKVKLINAGGKDPNLNVELIGNTETLTISCNEIEAKNATKFLYEEIFLSFREYSNKNGKIKRVFVDVYDNSDDLIHYKEDYLKLLNSVTINNNINLLVNYTFDIIGEGHIKTFEKMLKLFIHKDYVDRKIGKQIIGTILMCSSHLGEDDKRTIDWENYYKILQDEYK